MLYTSAFTPALKVLIEARFFLGKGMPIRQVRPYTSVSLSRVYFQYNLL